MLFHHLYCVWSFPSQLESLLITSNRTKSRGEYDIYFTVYPTICTFGHKGSESHLHSPKACTNSIAGDKSGVWRNNALLPTCIQSPLGMTLLLRHLKPSWTQKTIRKWHLRQRNFHSFEVPVIHLITVGFFHWCLQRQLFMTLGIAQRGNPRGGGSSDFLQVLKNSCMHIYCSSMQKLRHVHYACLHSVGWMTTPIKLCALQQECSLQSHHSRISHWLHFII